VRRQLWRLIGEGVPTETAAGIVGVSCGHAFAMFSQAGGMPPLDLHELSGRYLSPDERETIALERAAGAGVREIARLLGRQPSTISRELRRNAAIKRPHYRPRLAQHKAELRARRPKPSKLASNPRLHELVQAKLLEKLSPVQIAVELRQEFPDDPSMQLSHESIYRSLFVQGRGELRRELTKCLRTGRALRKPRRRTETRGRIANMLMISERPAEADDRAVPGHWEGDLIIGAHGKSAIGTLVERATRFVILLHLPDGHGAEAVRDAIVDAMQELPEHLRRSLTWDQGIELHRHAEITVAADLPVYFCDPASPWQRGSNENTNGLLRQYFAKGQDLSVFPKDYLDFVAAQLNRRPRKTLDWKRPGVALNELLSAPPDRRVATTG
jgi:IS30 family transposase